MQTDYTCWNPGDSYQLTSLSGSSSSSSLNYNQTNCDQQPTSTATTTTTTISNTSIPNDSVFNMFDPTDSVNHLNSDSYHHLDYHHQPIDSYNYSQYYINEQSSYHINCDQLSIESSNNKCYSSESSSPELWDNYGLTDSNNNINQSGQVYNNYQSNVTSYCDQQQNSNQNDLNIGKTFTNDNNIGSIKANVKLTNKSTSRLSLKQSNNRKVLSVNKIKNENVSHFNSNQIPNHYHLHHQTHHPHHRSIEYRNEKYGNPEDEERRRRRRERNKVAATKCRNKKKVHVYKLCQESETLQLTNSSLKDEMLILKREEQRLNELLVKHLPYCMRRTLKPISDSLNL
ncbi:GATA zinc finger domain-containing protein 15-like [Tetranychus urticae]|uniref:BZIP domain-containing protein n=1 Tax=Tetranychus urticae TaxID=32264 RepID=T1JU07_TETUR|nr:GATA zinc finger domain-containing protein 15-like [Tetranychus urticae]